MGKEVSAPKLEAPEWFFMWATGKPYICAIVAWTRRGAIVEAEKAQGVPWKTLYGRGGRVVRCSVKPTNVRRNK